MAPLWAQVLTITLCLTQASGHGKVYQAWLADDGGKSLLVVDAAPKHLLDSTIFSRLLGLRDTSIGDGVTDTQVTDPSTEGDSGEMGDMQETAVPPEDKGQNADGPSGHNNHGQSMEGGTDQEQSTTPPEPASYVSADTTTEQQPVNEYEKAVAQWEEASIDDNDQMLEELLESFAVITGQGFAETTPEDGSTDEMSGSGHSPAELHSGLSESTEREHDVGTTNSADDSELDEIEHTKAFEFESTDASSGIESSDGSSSIPEQIEHSGHDTPNDTDKANANTVMLESLIAALNATEDADSLTSDSQEHTSGTTHEETAQKETYLPAGDPYVHSTDDPEDMYPPAYGSQGTDEAVTYTDEPLFPMRYPDRRPSPRSEVRAELPAGVVSVGDQQEIAFTPSAESRRTSVQFKPTAVIDGGHFDPEEYGLLDGPPAGSAPRQRSVPRLRDSLSAVVEAAEAGMLLVQPDWRGPGIMAVPMHRRPPAEMVCYLMVKQGACRCTHTRCAAFRKYMEYKCPETCEKVPVAPEPAGVSRGVRTRLLSSVRLPERPLGILSKCRGTALLMPRCRATQTYVAHPIFCECYRVCSGEFAGLTACPSGEHFSTQEAETRVCVPFEESTCRTWSRLVTKP
ncbi:hypothetical protein FJT64_021245 [Amphibalanus amphitrite]|uniref:Chitin-binding type-2 domain-containing protein n=1 Tax=Amphibalanus amphitrite TaxID=1232801 RepID=A0A6A4WJ08_AMPAM|nr:hypothetical protein FJT64_008760 [Amphibalanus amphitrite]KAF0307407.1 hypothetical protein FJT64_021245 [Amphibalanus amphitrite]